MAQSEKSTARFRSATEFPQSVQNMERAEADALYVEMRDCLIFTNRSRSQLVRRNQEHKEKAIVLQEDVQRLQRIISQLTSEKQLITQTNQNIIQALEAEMATMSSHLDELSGAFDDIADVETAGQAQWGFMAAPSRFFRFLRAVKAIVLWWREERSDDADGGAAFSAKPDASALPGEVIDEDQDRIDHPQMYTDQASVNRSLLDR